jgi:hypothetical protein
MLKGAPQSSHLTGESATWVRLVKYSAFGDTPQYLALST